MLISHPFKFIYLRTIKTASSSIERQFQAACLPDGHPTLPEDCDQLITNSGIIGARRILSKARTFEWWNHMSAAQIRDQLPPDIWNGYTKFTSVRNPYAKLVSLFWFKLKQPRHAERRQRLATADFETAHQEFNAWLERHSKIPYDGEIYRIDGDVVADRIIRYEHLQDDLADLISTLGLPKHLVSDQTPSLKTGLKLFDNPYQDYYNETSRKRVAERYSFELKTFDYKF